MLFGRRLSIIIPVHNGADYLARALDSAAGQDLDSLEILCIDDGSKDRSLDLLLDYRRKDRRLRVRALGKNQGTFFARNVGIGLARGKYILFLDCDDRLDRHIGRTCVDLADRKKLDLVAFGTRLLEKGQETDCDFANRTPGHRELHRRPLDRFLSRQISHMMCNRLYRTAVCRHALKLLGPDFCRLPLTHSEDLAFTVAALACSRTYYSIDRIGYYYCLREDSSNFAFRGDPGLMERAIGDHCLVIRRLGEVLPRERLADFTAATERLFVFFLEGISHFPPDRMRPLAEELVAAYDASQTGRLRAIFLAHFPLTYAEVYGSAL